MSSDKNGQNTFFGSIRQVSLSVDQYVSGLRHFTVIDGNMSDMTDGLYQYYVEMDIEDGTKTFLEDLLAVISNVRLGLERYYSESLQAQNYDYQANKFKQNFIDSQSAKYKAVMETAPWVYGPITYLDILNTLTMDAYASTMEEYIKALHALASPSTGTPDGINSLLNLAGSLESNLRSIIGLKRDSSNAEMAGNTRKRIVNIVHEMKHIFDSNVAKNAGIDYLSGQATNFDGLRVVTGTEWESRTTSETQKFYTTGIADLSLSIAGEEDLSPVVSTKMTEMTYLSPASIDLYNVSYDLLAGASNFDPSVCDEIVYTALNYSPTSAPSYSPAATATSPADVSLAISSTSLLEITANSGLTIMSMNDFRLISPPPDGLSEAQKYVGENSKFLSEDLDQEVFPEPEPVQLSLTSYNLLTALCGPCIFSNGQSPDSPGSAFDSPITMSPTLSSFNLASTSNPVVAKISNLTSNGYSSKTAKDMVIKELAGVPNQLKSLMVTAGTALPEASEVETSTQTTSLSSLSSAKPSVTKQTSNAGASSVRANWSATGVDSFTTETTISTMVVNYQMLSQIEVLSGYDGMLSGAPSVKAPIWQPMDAELYEANFGKLLLCRITRYSSSTFGVSTPSGVELPIYNEYFFLKPFDVTTVDTITETSKYPTPTAPALKSTTLPSLTVEVGGLLTTLGYSPSQEDIATIATEYISTMNIPSSNQHSTLNESGGSY